MEQYIISLSFLVRASLEVIYNSSVWSWHSHIAWNSILSLWLAAKKSHSILEWEKRLSNTVKYSKYIWKRKIIRHSVYSKSKIFLEDLCYITFGEVWNAHQRTFLSLFHGSKLKFSHTTYTNDVRPKDYISYW